MVNLRSREVPDKLPEAKVSTPRRRRASSAQPESPIRPRSRRLSSVEPEVRDKPVTPGSPRSQRKSLRTKTSQLTDILEKSASVPDAIFEVSISSPKKTRASKSPEKQKDSTAESANAKSIIRNLNSGSFDIGESSSLSSEKPNKTAKPTSPVRERKISGNRDEDSGHPIVLLKDCSGMLKDDGQSQNSKSSLKNRRGSVGKGTGKKISDYFLPRESEGKKPEDCPGISDEITDVDSEMMLSSEGRCGSPVKTRKRKTSFGDKSSPKDVDVKPLRSRKKTEKEDETFGGGERDSESSSPVGERLTAKRSSTKSNSNKNNETSSQTTRDNSSSVTVKSPEKVKKFVVEDFIIDEDISVKKSKRGSISPDKSSSRKSPRRTPKQDRHTAAAEESRFEDTTEQNIDEGFVKNRSSPEKSPVRRISKKSAAESKSKSPRTGSEIDPTGNESPIRRRKSVVNPTDHVEEAVAAKRNSPVRKATTTSEKSPTRRISKEPDHKQDDIGKRDKIKSPTRSTNFEESVVLRSQSPDKKMPNRLSRKSSESPSPDKKMPNRLSRKSSGSPSPDKKMPNRLSRKSSESPSPDKKMPIRLSRKSSESPSPDKKMPNRLSRKSSGSPSPDKKMPIRLSRKSSESPSPDKKMPNRLSRKSSGSPSPDKKMPNRLSRKSSEMKQVDPTISEPKLTPETQSSVDLMDTSVPQNAENDELEKDDKKVRSARKKSISMSESSIASEKCMKSLSQQNVNGSSPSKSKPEKSFEDGASALKLSVNESESSNTDAKQLISSPTKSLNRPQKTSDWTVSESNDAAECSPTYCAADKLDTMSPGVREKVSKKKIGGTSSALKTPQTDEPNKEKSVSDIRTAPCEMEWEKTPEELNNSVEMKDICETEDVLSKITSKQLDASRKEQKSFSEEKQLDSSLVAVNDEFGGKDDDIKSTPGKSKKSKKKRKSGSGLHVTNPPVSPGLDISTAEGTANQEAVTTRESDEKLNKSGNSEVFNVPEKKKKRRRRRKKDKENEVAPRADVAVKTSKKIKKKKKEKKKTELAEQQQNNISEPVDEIRMNHTLKMKDSEVTVRRRGGGTIIGSRPVFSDDAKYVYVNCGWGVRAFSIETGECVKVFDAYSKDHKVVACFCWESSPAALTSEGLFIVWDPRNGKVQQKVRLNVMNLVVDGFFISFQNETILCLVVEAHHSSQLRIYSATTFRSQNHPLNGRSVGYPYNLHRISWGGKPEHPFLAYITRSGKLRLTNMKGKSFLSMNPHGKTHWTCVKAHPTEAVVAAGDSIGRIIVYFVGNYGEPVPSVYHWHTLPVSDIAFTPSGSSMYSGGGELTLVKWNLDNPHIKNYLPRLSADIVHIAISPYNQMIAIATLDNGIQIVNPNNRLHCVLQQLSWSVFAGEQEGMFPAGLVYDPRSRGLILNGRPGHLQLYSPLSETLTCNIDVTMMNYLTQERDKVIVNTHVTHSALTSDGLWLATIETRYEPCQALELKLKFWEYSADKHRYVLATVIDMPHDGKIHSIKFSPGPTGTPSNSDVGPDNEVYLASTGHDKKLRLWTKTPIDSIYKKGSTWRCQNACFYRDRPCGPCSFSYDGSLLAVGFGPILTLWDVEKVVLKQTINRDDKELKFVEFGHNDCCHIVLCATDSNIVAWNLLTLSLVWQLETRTALFIPDPYSYFIAVFTVENQWKILDAHNGEVAYTMNSDGKSEVGNLSSKPQVLAGVFAPRHRPNPDAPKWMRNSYLYYIDIYQELNCLEPANEISQLPTFQLAVDKDVATPFGSLVGAKIVRESVEEETAKSSVGYGVLGFQAVTQLLRPPAHTLPPVSLLCGSFLQSFVIMKRDAPHADSDREDKSEDDKTTIVASSDSDSDTKRPKNKGKTPKSRKRRPNKPKEEVKPKEEYKSKKVDEAMETETIDLRQHFPPLDENDADSMFVIDD